MFLLLGFCDSACPDTPFWLKYWLLLGSTGPLEKQLKVCKGSRFQRFSPFEKRAFPKCWSWRRFSIEILQTLDFEGFWRLSFRHFWDQSSCKKKVRKTAQRPTPGIPEPGGVNPLKQLKGNKRSDMPQTRPGVPSGTVADIYIYIYIYIYKWHVCPGSYNLTFVMRAWTTSKYVSNQINK